MRLIKCLAGLFVVGADIALTALFTYWGFPGATFALGFLNYPLFKFIQDYKPTPQP